MPPKVQKSKAAKLLAATSSSKSKGKKKKWSKGKLREKKNHRVVFNKDIYNRFITEVPKKMKTITIYSLIDQYNINGSLARKGLRELLNKKLIIPVAPSGAFAVYTKHPDADKKEKKEKKEGGDKEKGEKGEKGEKQQKQQKQQKGGKKGGAEAEKKADEADS